MHAYFFKVNFLLKIKSVPSSNSNFPLIPSTFHIPSFVSKPGFVEDSFEKMISYEYIYIWDDLVQLLFTSVYIVGIPLYLHLLCKGISHWMIINYWQIYWSRFYIFISYLRAL